MVAKLCAQVPVGLNSSVVEVIPNEITVCEGENFTFTGFGGASYEFYRKSNTGVETVVRSRETTSTYDPGQVGPKLEDKDKVYVRVFSKVSGGSFTPSREITVNILPKPVVTLKHSAININETFCVGQEIVFTALPESTSSATYTYKFYLGTHISNVTLVQSSTSNTFKRELSVESTVLVQVSNANGCIGEDEASVRPVIIDDAGTIGIEGHGSTTYYDICYGSTPPKLVNILRATVDGNLKTPTSKSYQWMTSFDGSNWNPIPNAKEEDFQPSGIVSKTYFRRDITHGLNGGVPCSKPSKTIIIINPTAELKVGTIDNAEETVCKGDNGTEITVTENGTDPSFRYQWQKSLDGFNFNNILLNSGFKKYTPQTVTQTTYFRRVTSVPSASCSVTTAVHKVNVIEFDPGELDISSTVTICHGITPSVFTESVGATAVQGFISYQWQRSINNGISWSDINGANQSAYPPPAMNTTTWFRRVVSVLWNGKTCEAISTNEIKITVTPDLSQGDISSPDSKICLGKIPGTLTIRNLNPAFNGNILPSIQWESSLSEHSSYTTISGETQMTLPFDSYSAPKETTYYRAVISSPISSCDGTLAPVRIEVQQPHTLIHTGTAPLDKQDNICKGNSIVPIVFSYGGSASSIGIAPDPVILSGVGLNVTQDTVSQTLTISGEPTTDVDIVVTSIGPSLDVCSPITLNYKIDVLEDPKVPDIIQIGDTTIWQVGGGQLGSWEVCQGTVSTQFSGDYYLQEDKNANNLIWELVSPPNAGSVDPSSGLMTWNQTFHDKARFRVRGQSKCDGSKFSNWSDQFEITVIENNAFIDFPLNPIGEIQILNTTGSKTGGNPNCKTTIDTPDTQYHTTGKLSGVFWTVEVVEQGNSLVSNPGSIGLHSGLMQWNNGFWGKILIHADPTNCDGDNNPSGTISQTLRKTLHVDIPKEDNRVVDIYIPSSSGLPSCKEETDGFITQFKSNLESSLNADEDLIWTINNSKAGSIDPSNGRMTWDINFSGQVTVRADVSNSDQTCMVPFGEMILEIPLDPKITLTSGNSSYIREACQNTAIEPITYLLEEGATTADVIGLPTGIKGDFNATKQITSYTFSGANENAGVVYTVKVMERSYSFTTSSSISQNPGAAIVNELKQLMSGDLTIIPSVDGSQLILTAKKAGRPFTSSISTSGATSSMSISAPSEVKETRTFTISGSSDATGSYDFTVSARNGDSVTCINSSVVAVEGTIHIRPKGFFELKSAVNTIDQKKVCYGSPIQEIVYDIKNASNAFVDGLPSGVTGVRKLNQFVISGTPIETITTSTTYVYTVKTINTNYDCEEGIATGKITVLPNLSATLTSLPFTQDQTLSEGEAMDEVVYQLNGVPDLSISGNLSFDISKLPAGVSSPTYNVSSGTFIFSGTPKPDPPINETTVYTYTLTTKRCDGTSDTTTNTLTINPAPRLELIPGYDTIHQIICDTEAIEEIRYIFRGATDYDNFQVTPNAGWISDRTIVPVEVMGITGTPTNPYENTITHTYFLQPRGTSYGYDYYPTVSGTITVKPSQQLELTSSPDTVDQEVCNNSNIEPIVYEFRGSTQRVDVTGLPAGITSKIIESYPKKQIDIRGSNAAVGESHNIRINNQLYTYTASGGESPATIAGNLVTEINKGSVASATISGSTTVIIEGRIQGVIIDTEVLSSANANVIMDPPILLKSHGIVKIKGTLTLPGDDNQRTFDYTITTVGATSCSPTIKTGKIIIRPKASFTLKTSNDNNQEICYGEPIADIIYDINNADSAEVLPKGSIFTDGLPLGVTGNVAGGQLIISGTPNETITTTATFVFTIKTKNKSGCDEAIASGNITVLPNLSATLISDPFTQTQTLCEGDAMEEVVYQLNGVPDFSISGNLSFDISKLPAGVSSPTYNVGSRTFIFSGTPKPDPPINETTVYTFTLTTKRCDGTSETTTNTLTINPAPRLELTPGYDIIHQTICDTEAIEEIRYKFRGATDYDNFQVSPNAGWISDRTILSSQVMGITGTPITPHENTIRYTYSLQPKGTTYGCTTYPTVSGTITVKPSQQLELISSPDTVNQERCNNSNIEPIIYEFRGSTKSVSVNNLPLGLNPQIIEVKPEKQINLRGTSAAKGESHSIWINEQLFTNTASGGESPAQIANKLASAINKGLVASATVVGSNITIVGSAIGVIIDTEVHSSLGSGVTLDLPILVKSHGRIEITGTPTLTDDVNPRTFNYTITTMGSNSCSSTTKTGTIIIRSKPTLTLKSPLGTDQQTVYNAVCDGSTITPIEYIFGGSATKVKFSGLPSGVTVALTSSNTYTISGKLNVNNQNQRTFTYSATTDGQSCSPQVVMTGMIEVNPLPVIFTDYIIANDIAPISCEGGSDGAITIPEESPGFENRIGGAQNHIRQVDHVTITNNPSLSDIFTIEINGDPYQHTVIPTSLGGPIQTAEDVANALIDKINLGTNGKESDVMASYNATNTIVIKAKVAGTPFIINAVNVAPSSSASTMTATTTVANRTTLYSYTWTGPDQFISSDLSISNLKAGVYALTVTINNCVGTTASFTLSEPVSMTIDTALCNGTLHAEVSGGVAPYTFKLYDDKNTLLNTAVSNAAKTYEGLTPGADYILEILDDKCNISKQKQIKVPFDLAYDAAIPVVVPDYCNDDDGDGFIELGGNAAGMAFSGGSDQFIYKWVGPDNYGAMTRDIYNLEPGVYTVKVTDAVLGCETTKSFTIDSVDPIIVTATQNSIDSFNLYCPDDKTAAIEITVTGGLGNYSYSWTKDGVVMPGKKSKKLDKLGKGIYVVTVSDAMPSGAAAILAPCSVSEKFEVTGPSPLTMVVNSGTVTKTFCPNTEELASLDVEISGGTPPYTIVVTAEDGTLIPVTTSNLNTTISDLDPSKNGSTYTVEISDSNTCTLGTASSTTIFFESIAPIEIKTQVDQIDCKNGKLGRIKLDLISGKIENPEAVQVQWKSAATNFYTTWAAGEGILEDIMTPGTYQVTISQDTCELFKQTVEINDVNDTLQVSVLEEKSGGCNGELGQVSLDIKGGLIPYTVKWQKFKLVSTYDTVSATTAPATTVSNTNASTTFVSETGDSLTMSMQWVDVLGQANNAIAMNLDVGTYRAIVSDSSDELNTNGLCAGTVITRNFIIGRSVYELASFDVNSGNSTCSESTSEIEFKIRNSLPGGIQGVAYEPIILLNNADPQENLQYLGNNTYKIIDLKAGDYILNIKPGNPQATTSSQTLSSEEECSIIFPFNIEEVSPIEFTGKTSYQIDPCTDTVAIEIISESIEGGVPFNIGGLITYDYNWVFTPESGSAQATQQFVGNTIANATVGSYELIISDSNGCESEPVLFTVTANEVQTPFMVEGILQDLSSTESTTTLVKVLSPTCETSTPNGQIGISISGGSSPYSIQWFKEEINEGIGTTSTTASFVEILAAKNTTLLKNLDSGVYKLEIRSQINNCGSNIENNSFFHSEFIVVPKRVELLITDGPYIDQDLCLGEPGRLFVELFNNSNDPSFYYNGKVVAVDEDLKYSENGYTLIIENPVPLAELVITNEQGCKVTSKIEITDIGDPDFEYTTPSFEADGVILAREEITFENTSSLPYKYSEWIFGDGTENFTEVRTGTVSPVRHSYGISG
ncbi:hypothetical protein OA501_01110, partial [Flavobacteriaceae bacterium]|nr:hypothetical protein [Flavobacteriaceae bacterium]